jgi:hypothetical protein
VDCGQPIPAHLLFVHGKMASDSGYDSEPTIDTAKVHGDWRDQLYRDGYVVLKQVVSPERAKHYVDSLFDWLETFPYGFSKHNATTWGPKNLPAHVK